MNNGQRKILNKIVTELFEAVETLNSQAEEEMEKFENMGEGFQQSEKGERIEGTTFINRFFK